MEMNFNGPERQVDVCHVKKGREFSSSRDKVNVEAIRPGSQNRKVDLGDKKNGVWVYI